MHLALAKHRGRGTIRPVSESVSALARISTFSQHIPCFIVANVYLALSISTVFARKTYFVSIKTKIQ